MKLTVKRRGPHLLSLLLVLAPLLKGDTSPQPDASQTGPATLKKLSLEELSQIEVTTPSKEPVKAFHTTSAIYVLTGEDIRRSGVTSIPAALRLVPGVEVARIDSNKWSVGIRGFGSRLTRSVLVLIDGRTVFTPLFAGTYWEVQNTMMEDIDRIEVIRGPGGTIWGPNAVNGVINIITKDAKDTQGTLVSAGGGNDEQGFVNFRYGGATARASTIAFTVRASPAAPSFTRMAGILTTGERVRPASVWTGRKTIAIRLPFRAIFITWLPARACKALATRHRSHGL
jgi:iron complex outermembrane receptor protein